MHIELFGLEIDIQSSGRPRWERSVRRTASVQLDGFRQFETPSLLPEENRSLRVTVRDVADLDRESLEMVVPGQYAFADGLLFDAKGDRALRLSPGRVEYWCASAYGLSFPFLVQLSLLDSDWTLLHAGAIAVNGQGIVLPAFGGIGKTMILGLLLEDLEDDTQLLGDDLVFLSRQGHLVAYPRPFCFYAYHREVFSSVFARFDIKHRRPSFPWHLYSRLTTEVYDRTGLRLPHSRYHTFSGSYVTVSPLDIYDRDRIASEALPLDKIIYLERSRHLNSPEVAKVPNRMSLARKAAAITHHEWGREHKFLAAYRAHSGQSFGELFQASEQTVTSAFQRGSSAHSVSISRTGGPREAYPVVHSLVTE